MERSISPGLIPACAAKLFRSTDWILTAKPSPPRFRDLFRFPAFLPKSQSTSHHYHSISGEDAKFIFTRLGREKNRFPNHK
jgi:hypothetical protein